VVCRSILLTETVIETGAVVRRSIVDKRPCAEDARVGGMVAGPGSVITMIAEQRSSIQLYHRSQNVVNPMSPPATRRFCAQRLHSNQGLHMKFIRSSASYCIHQPAVPTASATWGRKPTVGLTIYRHRLRPVADAAAAPATVIRRTSVSRPAGNPYLISRLMEEGLQLDDQPTSPFPDERVDSAASSSGAEFDRAFQRFKKNSRARLKLR
jgi:hypothetical protein